jgi:hypothetical protein
LIEPTPVGSINPVNPVYVNSVEQIHAVDRIAIGDSNQPRSALGAHPCPGADVRAVVIAAILTRNLPLTMAVGILAIRLIRQAT